MLRVFVVLSSVPTEKTRAVAPGYQSYSSPVELWMLDSRQHACAKGPYLGHSWVMLGMHSRFDCCSSQCRESAAIVVGRVRPFLGNDVITGPRSPTCCVSAPCCFTFPKQVESEEDLPFSLDIYKIVDMAEAARRTHLTDLLKTCPSRDAGQAFIDKYLHKIKHLNPHLP